MTAVTVAAPWGVYRVPSQRIRGLIYKVLFGPTGASCTCAAYEFKRECPHIREVEGMTTTTAVDIIRTQPPVATLPTAAELRSMDMIAARLIETKEVAIPSGLKSTGDVRAVILAGWELGVKPMTAMRHMSVINGKTEPDGQLMAGIVMAKEPDIRFEIIEDTDEATTVRLIRPSKSLKVEFRYSQTDAERAGLLKVPTNRPAGPWLLYPRDMRRWACYKRLCRAYCGDIINGISTAIGTVQIEDTPSQAEDDVDGGTFIEGEARVIEPGEVDPDDLDESDLYNEGDAPAMATDEQLNRIADWHASIEDRYGQTKVAELGKWGKEQFPNAVESNRLKVAKLTEHQASLYIEAAKHMGETGALPAAQQAALT